MPTNYVFPTSQELRTVAQEKLPTLNASDPIFSHFPIVEKNSISLRWEQRDNFTGLQQLRGVGGSPQRVLRIGAKSYDYQPGVYGEFITLDEKELLERRPMGSWDGFVNINDLVMDAQDQLLQRRYDRYRYILWTLMTTGTFSVSLPSGGVGHTDQYANIATLGQFGMQTAVAAFVWSNFAAATPMQDLRALQLGERGRSISLGTNAVAYMNRTTFNNMVRNTNTADLGGKTTFLGSGFGSVNSVGDINRILIDANLPRVEIYDQGYEDPAGTFNLWIPTGTVLVVGARTNGDPLGEYRLTRNLANLEEGGTGAYQRVMMKTDEIPGHIEVHDGHNGGPVIYYPSAIVRLTGA